MPAKRVLKVGFWIQLGYLSLYDKYGIYLVNKEKIHICQKDTIVKYKIILKHE